MKERGSALLTAIIVVMVLLSISGIFFTTVINQAKNEVSQEKALKAYYLAEAGIQYTKVRNGTIKKDEPLPESKTVNNPFGQGGRFVVKWENSDEGSAFIVTSTATYSGIVRKKAAKYMYEVELEETTELPVDRAPPAPPAPESKNRLIWEKEIVDE